MKDKKLIIIGIGVLFIVFALNVFLILHFFNQYNTSDIEKKIDDYQYSIHYYSDFDEYEIRSYYDSDMLKILKKSNDTCNAIGCSSNNYTEHSTEYSKRYKDFFNQIFSKIDSNEVFLPSNLLDSKYRILLDEIIGMKFYNLVSYDIIEKDSYSKRYGRGYYVEQDEEGTIVTIASGVGNTGGYGIDVTNVNKTGENITIHVKETSPDPNSSVTMALTYPSVTIKLYYKTDNITVIDDNTGNEFSSDINGYREKK